MRLDDASVQATLPCIADQKETELNTLARASDKSRRKIRKKYSSTGVPGGKMSWFRRQALQRCIEINDYEMMIRDKDGKLQPDLQLKLDQMHNLFRAWKRDVRNKKIILRNVAAGKYEDPFLILDYKTRFNDNWRAWKNEKAFKGGIETSLRKYQTAVFLTLTTDPKIFMSPRGEEFTRHIKDGKRTRAFTGTGKGLNLLAADRHESTAWRKWYEAECYRRGFRIPYIRVAEFQKNGLIHTHILLFGIQWDTPWHEFANDWGTKYQQGFMNKAYQVENRGGKWVWAHAEYRPEDANNRDPADYLMKYLKKAQDVPAVKCKKCGEIISVPDDNDVLCPACGTHIKAPRDGRFMYWVCGKRFFTMSQSLRVYDFDADIAAEDRKKRQTAIYEYLGAEQGGDVEKFIAAQNGDEAVPKNAREAGDVARFLAEYRRDHSPPIRDIWVRRLRNDEFWKKWPFEDEEAPPGKLPPDEDPDTNDDIDLADFLGSITPERIAYENQLVEETRLMEERRKRLSKERSGSNTS
ncbi:MAG: hypothetical protein O0X96_05675 [Methanocorpusculum sp.]|nr:hypothetical protein [Methanocorpusculum sp.]